MYSAPGKRCYNNGVLNTNIDDAAYGLNGTIYRITRGGHYYVLSGYYSTKNGIHVHDTEATAFDDYNVTEANKVLASGTGSDGVIIAVKKK